MFSTRSRITGLVRLNKHRYFDFFFNYFHLIFEFEFSTVWDTEQYKSSLFPVVKYLIGEKF